MFGYSVASVGDLDGDGISELAVGAPGDDDGGSGRGAIWILHLHPNGTVKAHQKISDDAGEFTGVLENSDLFGVSVAPIGDLDNDGTMDIVVGAPLDDDGGSNTGSLWVLFLNPSGTVKNHQKISATTGGFTGSLDSNGQFGWSMAAVGQIDDDGIVDLVVGAPADNDGGTAKGAVWVLFMESTGMVKFHQKISAEAGNLTGHFDDHDGFGWSVAAIGDLDANGTPDFSVGAVGDDDGGTDKGAVWVLLMDSTGMVKFHQKISDESGHFTGTLDSMDFFGFSASGIGDLNGDNIPDLVVGMPHATNEGAVWILYMNGKNE